jgi:hypothetical protein
VKLKIKRKFCTCNRRRKNVKANIKKVVLEFVDNVHLDKKLFLDDLW